MKRILSLFCVFALVIALAVLPAAANTEPKTAQPEVNSEAAIVLDVATGVTLYQKNEKSQLAPGDPAQLVTALVALESGKAGQTVTVTKEIAQTFDAKGTNIPLAEGEEVTMRDLLYAMMLGSYSDAAKTVAATVSGSEKAFATAMTERIQKVTGTQSSAFANADGEPADGNRTTAKDLAMFVREALKNAEFRQLFGATAHTMGPTNKNASERSFTTICLLMRNSDMNVKYDYATAAKSGWNKDAKYTLVSVAEKDGRELICVVLGAENSKQRYTETIDLFNYAFSAFRNVEVPTTLLAPTEIPVIKDGKVARTVIVSIPEGTKLSTNVEFQDGTMTVSSLPTSVQEGATNIVLTVSAKDKNNITVVLGSVILDVETKATEEENVDTNLGGQTSVPKSFGEKLWDFVKTVLLILMWIIIAIVGLLALLIAISYFQRRSRKTRKRRTERSARRSEEEPASQPSAYTGRRHRGAQPPVETDEDEDDDEDEY